MPAFMEERSRVPDAVALNCRRCKVVRAKPGERLLEVGNGSGMLRGMRAPSVGDAGSGALTWFASIGYFIV
jgi:hypothetical protein